MAGNAWCEGLIQSTYSCCLQPATPGHGHRDCWREKKFCSPPRTRLIRGRARDRCIMFCFKLNCCKAETAFWNGSLASTMHELNIPAKSVEFASDQSPIIAFPTLAFTITHSLTHWCFWDSFDVTLAENDAKSQSVYVIDCWCYCSWVDESDSLT